MGQGHMRQGWQEQGRAGITWTELELELVLDILGWSWIWPWNGNGDQGIRRLSWTETAHGCRRSWVHALLY